MKQFFTLFVCAGLLLMQCKEPALTTSEADKQENSMKYLALGDSYTIGESVEASERWPVQLVNLLNEAQIPFSPPTIIARTGWTTAELANGIASASPAANYDLVSLLIGVNNQFRSMRTEGFTLELYAQEFTSLLEQAIGFAKGNKERVFVVSIPDYGITPFAASLNRERIASELDAYNALAREICEAEGILFFNITPISRQATDDPSLIASDGLHPSGTMYQAWARLIAPTLVTRLKP
jgi:lysophospholipase L1-like esterase